MKQFFTGFFLGLIFAATFVGILVVAAMRFGEKKVSVAGNSTLVLHLQGDLPEQAPVEYPLEILQQQQPLTMVETWQLLRKAAADSRIKALVLEPQDLTVGWAKLEELRDDVNAFKKSGKPVYAYLRGAGAHEYYVATAADRIYMSPEDELDLKGLRAELMYVKGTLDKLGVDMEFEHVGKYKDAPDMYTRTSPTPETLQVENEVLDQYYGDLVGIIAQGRRKQPEQIRALIDQGPFVGDEALDGGLVDGLLYDDQMYGKLKDQLKLDTERIGERDYAKAPVAGMEGPTRIAFLAAEGDITRGNPYQDGAVSGITASALVPLLRKIGNDSSIKGVIFRIDSPGGDGIASDDILNAAKEVSAKKPMIISMSDLAASGGYFIAMTGDPIVAYPNTLTGSIGVFFGKANLAGLFGKIGINIDILKRGQFADIDSAARPLTDAERAKLRREIEVMYRNFVERVAAGRKRPYDQVEPLAQGRVWVGALAKQNRLVDDLGGLDRAVDLIKERLKIPVSEKVTLVMYPPRRSLFDLLFNRSDNSANMETMMENKLGALAGNLPVRALAHGGILELMPYSIQVK
ncbi:MAG TPA: signal peptide peptidase SppA [Bryobacteraceae bacterium]|nr:signal peptide peptidase SppA [Bryobacteraceae bacterium]